MTERVFAFKTVKQRKLTAEEKATARDARERLKQQRERIGEPGDPHELFQQALAGDTYAQARCARLYTSPTLDSLRKKRERHDFLQRSREWNLIQQTAQTRKAVE